MVAWQTFEIFMLKQGGNCKLKMHNNTVVTLHFSFNESKNLMVKQTEFAVKIIPLPTLTS